MIIVKLLFFPYIFFSFIYSYAQHEYNPLVTDNRIKTYIYSENDVYLLVLHQGFQSYVEFEKNEVIETIILGDSYAWKVTPINHRLFINPMQKNIRTNMSIITNKRTYNFDIVAKDLEDNEEQDLVYVIRFYYPKIVK